MSDDEDENGERDGDVSSGPWCSRHWQDPYDCDVVCATCGHECHFHDRDDHGYLATSCCVSGCTCAKFTEPETP